MVRPGARLVAALRATAARLESGATYLWSHFAACNCGHLAQTVTRLEPRAIYEAAFQRPGDWGEQAREHCTSSGLPIDHILEALFALGLAPADVGHLERLSDDAVVRAVGRGELRHAVREDVVAYLRAWADLLEAELPAADRRAA